MKHLSTLRRAGPLALVSLALAAAFFVAPQAQTQVAPGAPQAYLQYADQIAKQQEQLIVNQAKIDEQLAALKEELRYLKIYTKRSR